MPFLEIPFLANDADLLCIIHLCITHAKQAYQLTRYSPLPQLASSTDPASQSSVTMYRCSAPHHGHTTVDYYPVREQAQQNLRNMGYKGQGR